MAARGERQDKPGGAEAAARFKQYDYRAVRLLICNEYKHMDDLKDGGGGGGGKEPNVNQAFRQVLGVNWV